MIRTVSVFALGLLAASAALAQDAPPPGCRWQSYQGDTILACKDGAGHWRRAGDDQIVGSYALAPKPKPKPKPKETVPQSAATAAPSAGSAAEPAPGASQTAATPAPPAAEPVAAGFQPAAEEPAPKAAETSPPAATPAAAPEPPWWRKALSGIWNALLAMLRLFGLLH